MKRLILIIVLLVPLTARAQPAQTGPTASQRATETMLSREIVAHQNDLAAAMQLQDEVTGLQKQVADLTKERDALKAAPKADAPVAPKQ
jgi:hypothetical protein